MDNLYVLTKDLKEMVSNKEAHFISIEMKNVEESVKDVRYKVKRVKRVLKSFWGVEGEKN